MKALLIALMATAAAAPLGQDPLDPPPPMPIDCPICGGDPSMHNRLMSSLAMLQIRAGVRYFDAIF